ncbi:MAG: hypothetical protein QXL16_02410 [Candidatus Micrarchaeaceae archaeon]
MTISLLRRSTSTNEGIDIVKRLVKASWIEEAKENGLSNEQIIDLEDHFVSMNEIFGSISYEIHTADMLIAKCKNEKRNLRKLLKYIEAISAFYSEKYGRSVAELAAIGLAKKMPSLGFAKEQLFREVGILEKSLKEVANKHSEIAAKIEAESLDLSRMKRNILRRIAMRNRIKEKEINLERLRIKKARIEAKKRKYERFMNSLSPYRASFQD